MRTRGRAAGSAKSGQRVDQGKRREPRGKFTAKQLAALAVLHGKGRDDAARR